MVARRTIYPTDGAFRGVTVPEGTSRVEFRYEPRAFPIGVSLAAAGLVGFLGHRVDQLVAAQRRRGPSAQLRACAAIAEQQLRRFDRSIQAAGRFRAHTNISPMLTATSRCRTPSAAGAWRDRGTARPSRVCLPELAEQVVDGQDLARSLDREWLVAPINEQRAHRRCAKRETCAGRAAASAIDSSSQCVASAPCRACS